MTHCWSLCLAEVVECLLNGCDTDLPGDLTDTVLTSRGVVSGVLSTEVMGVVLVLLPNGKLFSARSIAASFCCLEALQKVKWGQLSSLLQKVHFTYHIRPIKHT